jgi:hypothetical protein
VKVVVHELNTAPLRQKILIGAKPVMVHAIRPYIFKWLAPAGSVYMQIQDSSGNKILDSETIAISALSAQNYFHGFYRFLVDFGFAAETEYYIAMKGSGYTYSSIAFIGWCNAWEIKNSSDIGYSAPNTGLSAPLGMQFWSYDHRTKGDY